MSRIFHREKSTAHPRMATVASNNESALACRSVLENGMNRLLVFFKALKSLTPLVAFLSTHRRNHTHNSAGRERTLISIFVANNLRNRSLVTLIR
jgi:hypothetical protein